MPENFNLKEYVKSERFVESAILILFVSLFIFLKLAQPWGYQIAHPHPAYYNANDNFGNGYVYPQYVKETGNFRYEPPYTVGGEKGIVGYYPPLLSHLSAGFSIISGIETYDATYLIVTFLSIAAMVLMYFVIRVHSKELAILSLPFMMGVFNFDFEVARAFGLWIFLAGAAFLTAVIWISDRLGIKYSAILLAIFLIGAIFGHTSEAIFAGMYLAYYFVLKYLKEHTPDKAWIKNVAYGTAAALILSAYYLIIFKYTWMEGVAGYKFEVMAAPAFAPSLGVKLSDFGLALPLIFAGMLIGLKRIVFRKKEEIPFTTIASGFFVLIVGYMNYVGFGTRAWQTRISWPVYFAAFAGISIYYIYKKVFKESNFSRVAFICVVLVLSFAYLSKGELQGDGIVSQSGWNTLMWVKDNTPAESKVLYYYGTLQTQMFSLWSAERVPYGINQDDYVKSAEQGILRTNYSVRPLLDDGTRIPYQKGLFDYVYKLDDVKPESSDNMDYYVLPIGAIGAGNPYVAQYNAALAESLLKQPEITEVYKNEDYVILKKSH